MTRLLIVRHGNTFAAEEVPRRVGVHTDLPLVESGIEQAKALGRHLKEKDIVPSVVYTSELQRTQQTSDYILKEMGIMPPRVIAAQFNEIDYGPDENMPEESVLARLGEKALRGWDQEAIVPPGWDFNPDRAIAQWQAFGARIKQDYPDQTVMVVTSNGIARFAPYLTGNFLDFRQNYPVKLKTGSYGLFQNQDDHWCVECWGIRP